MRFGFYFFMIES